MGQGKNMRESSLTEKGGHTTAKEER